VKGDIIDAQDVNRQTTLQFVTRGKQAGGNYEAVTKC
jgi:hypothetical protein